MKHAAIIVLMFPFVGICWLSDLLFGTYREGPKARIAGLFPRLLNGKA